MHSNVDSCNLQTDSPANRHTNTHPRKTNNTDNELLKGIRRAQRFLTSSQQPPATTGTNSVMGDEEQGSRPLLSTHPTRLSTLLIYSHCNSSSLLVILICGLKVIPVSKFFGWRGLSSQGLKTILEKRRLNTREMTCLNPKFGVFP